MKKKNRGSGDGQGWLNTYADMITLVLTFFVLLYSISNVNMTKLEKVAQAMQKKLGIENEIELKDVDPEIKYPEISEKVVPEKTVSQKALEEIQEKIDSYAAGQGGGVSVTGQDNVLYIRFKNDVLFGPDSPALQPAGTEYLNYVGDVLKSKEPEVMAIYINGHTADAPNSAWNDRILSSDRANNVAIFFEQNKAIDPKKLISRGYGKNYPIADNSTKEGRNQNRRVDLIVLGKDFQWSDVTGTGNGSAEQFDPLTPIEVPGTLAE